MEALVVMVLMLSRVILLEAVVVLVPLVLVVQRQGVVMVEPDNYFQLLLLMDQLRQMQHLLAVMVGTLVVAGVVVQPHLLAQP